MENTQNSITRKQELLLKEIQNIKTQIAEVNEKMRDLENEEKQENYQKNFLEVKKDGLKRSIEFLKNEATETDKKLEEKETAFSKLSMMDECYGKLLDVCREKYLNCQGFSDLCPENSLEECVNIQKQTDNLEKEIGKLTSLINKNSGTINHYLEEMHYVIQ